MMTPAMSSPTTAGCPRFSANSAMSLAAPKTRSICNNKRTVSALSDVSLSLDSGQFAAVVGRSGCGKSTLLNLAGAMDFPTQGEVWIDGNHSSNLDDAGLTALRCGKVGFIFQNFQLLSTL